MPKGVPLTEEEQQRRRKEIFDASVHLFLEKGFSQTSLREIAEAAGIGKSTLYDYFRSKDEILVSYFESEIQKITDRAQEIARQELSISEKLRQIMQMHLEYLIANKNFYLKLTVASQTLSLGSQEKIQAKRHGYQDMLRALIEEGIGKGELRPVNSLLAARSVFNLLATAVFTSRPTGTPDEMLQDAFDIFFYGIQA
jgi:TetR/AcrR family transcriptional regulator, cholesterol catabolism regulator